MAPGHRDIHGEYTEYAVGVAKKVVDAKYDQYHYMPVVISREELQDLVAEGVSIAEEDMY